MSEIKMSDKTGTVKISRQTYDDSQAEIAQLKAELKLSKENHALSSAQCSREMLKLAELHNGVSAQVNAFRESLAKNQEWVRCGIGGNCGGYPQDHKDYIAITELLNKTPQQCLASVKADEVARVKNEITVASLNAELSQDDIINYLESETNKIRESAK